MTNTQVTSTGVAITLALVVAIGLVFFGPNVFALFSPAPVTQGSAGQTASTTIATSTAMNENGSAAAPAPIPNPLPTELTGSDTIVGTGEEAKAGDTVTVNYVGMLPDGTVFDASKNHGTSGFTFPLGAGQVIKGWDLGVAGMKVGGTRRLIIPPAYGYGSQSAGSIPPNSTLIFDVELLNVSHS